MGAFFKEFPDAFHLFCTWHLMNNVFDPRAGKARRSPAIEKLIWGLQASESKEEFEKKLTGLAAESPNAAAYLGDLPREKCRRIWAPSWARRSPSRTLRPTC